jgi:hypothetical protein
MGRKKLTVPYSIFLAQFFSFSPRAQASTGDTTGIVITIETSFRKARLFTMLIVLVWKLRTG